MMIEKVTLGEALEAAASEYTWESKWTADGKNEEVLSEWLNRAASTDSNAEMFLFDGYRIVRQGPDIQDCQILMYIASVRCDGCDRFLQINPRSPTRASIVTSNLCIGCMSGGVINSKLFR